LNDSLAANRTVCFSHGKESGPWGTKIGVLAEVARDSGWLVESLDYRGMDDPHARVEKLTDWCSGQTAPFVLVGSSMGGHVALAAAQAVVPLGVFVMAPALYVAGYERWTPDPPACPVSIVHGWHDDIIPWQNSVRFGEHAHATLLILDSDHQLTDVLDRISAQFEQFLQLLG